MEILKSRLKKDIVVLLYLRKILLYITTMDFPLLTLHFLYLV